MNNNSSYEIKAKGAFLGAAIGDALGWPQEIAWKNTTLEKAAEPIFKRWIRKSGTRYFSYEEIINEGEYSDDTQLLLATGRCLIRGDNWWKIFSEAELPFWTVYERGGGGATKRAADTWLNGKRPWDHKNKSSYFNAGGNGVAMRVLPHCLYHAKDKKFDATAHEITLNGVITHGHPRALVGSLAYGYALWVALQESQTLQYGFLIDKILDSCKEWAGLCELKEFPDWIVQAENVNKKYKTTWLETVEEIKKMLSICKNHMRHGALSIDKQALTEIGCFDSKINGAGTVSAVAAIFLTSRYAVDPMHGVLEAAFTGGIDTDTVASMTGGLLGAIAGIDWMNRLDENVQDNLYIKTLATNLINHNKIPSTDLFGSNDVANPVCIKDIANLIHKISQEKETRVVLPGHRSAIALSEPVRDSSRTMQLYSWKIKTEDGQTIYLKKISATKSLINVKEDPRVVATKTKDDNLINLPTIKNSNIIDLRIKIFASDLTRMKDFFEKVVGLSLLKESPSIITFDKLCIYKKMKDEKEYKNVIISFHVKNLDEIYNKIRVVTKIVKVITHTRNKKLFVCSDLEGNLIEFYQDV